MNEKEIFQETGISLVSKTPIEKVDDWCYINLRNVKPFDETDRMRCSCGGSKYVIVTVPAYEGGFRNHIIVTCGDCGAELYNNPCPHDP